MCEGFHGLYLKSVLLFGSLRQSSGVFDASLNKFGHDLIFLIFFVFCLLGGDFCGMSCAI